MKGRRFSYNERIARLRLNPFTSTTIKFLAESQEPWTYQQLQTQSIARMMQTLLASTGDDARDQEEEQRMQLQAQVEQQVIKSLEHLVTHTALRLDLRIPAHEDDKLFCLIERLAAIPGEWVAEICASLTELHRLTLIYGSATSAESAQEVLGEIRQQVLDHLPRHRCATRSSSGPD